MGENVLKDVLLVLMLIVNMENVIVVKINVLLVNLKIFVKNVKITCF